MTLTVRKTNDFLTVGAAAPLQEAAAVVLALPESYYAELAATYARCRQTLYEALDAARFQPYLPTRAYYIMTEMGWLAERLGCEGDMALAVNSSS